MAWWKLRDGVHGVDDVFDACERYFAKTGRRISFEYALVDGVNDTPYHVIDGFRDTVEAAARRAEAGDIVLLSPACTSFDRFKNFEERGKTFRKIVEGLE